MASFRPGLVLRFPRPVLPRWPAFASTEWNCTGEGAKYYDYAHPERNTTAAGKSYDGYENPQLKITVDDEGYVIIADGVQARLAGVAPQSDLAPRGGAHLSTVNGWTLYLTVNEAGDFGNLAQEARVFQNFYCYRGPVPRGD